MGVVASVGGGVNRLVRFFWSGIRTEKESWVVHPNLFVINVLLNLLDNVIECADCPGEVIHIQVDD